MESWHPYQKSELVTNPVPRSDRRSFRGLSTLTLMGALIFGQPLATATPDSAPNTIAASDKPLINPAALPDPAPEAGPKLPVYNGPYCQDEQSSLVATLDPSDPTDLRLNCAANGLDVIHRFVTVADFPREQILNDYQNRISEEFKTPEELKKRVGFWFDVYTKYPSYMKVLHHARYPWIRFKEIDLTEFLVQPKVKWMRIQAADQFVSAEKKRLVARLEKLARIKSPDGLSSDDRALYDLLAEVPGSRAKVFRDAANLVRIQTGQMDFYVEALMRKSQYLEMMEEIFRNANLPTELIRLPLVESSFNPFAVSKAGAAGVWQFMPATGRSIMKVSDWIDERRSPVKSTVGAARYLKSTHRMLYNSWPLTILAYNHGPGGVRKASRLAGSRDITQIIARYESKSFSFASKNYYAEFLAALYAERYQKEIFGQVQGLPKVEFEPVKIVKSIKPSVLARKLNLTLDVLSGYNLDMKASIAKDRPLPPGYIVHVPAGYATQLAAVIETEAFTYQ